MKRLILGGLLTCFLGAMQVAQAADPVQLRYKFTPGEKVTYRTVTKTKQEVSVAGQEIANTIEITATATQDVERKTEDEQFRVKSTTKRIQVSSDFGQAGGKYKFDSEDLEHEGGSVLSEALNPVFESLAGLEVTYTVSDIGEVRDISGYEEAMKAMLQGNPAGIGIGGGASNDAFKSNISDGMPQLPKEAVKTGDSWEVPYELTMKGLGVFSGKRTYTLEKVEDKDGHQVATISMDLEMEGSIDLKNGPVKITGTFEVADSDAKYNLDLETGRITSSEMKFSIDGDLKTEINNQTIPSDIHQEQSVSTQKIPNAE